MTFFDWQILTLFFLIKIAASLFSKQLKNITQFVGQVCVCQINIKLQFYSLTKTVDQKYVSISGLSLKPV